MKYIHLGSVIKQKLKESSMSNEEFADKINRERTTIYDIFERKSVDSELLFRISEALNFDFYNELYLNKKTTHFSKKIFIGVEIEEEKIGNLDLKNFVTKLLSID